MRSFHKSQTPEQETFENITITKSLNIINGNILYLTHEIDQIKRIVQQIHNTDNAQKQVDNFYKTSPQTDSDEQ